MARRTLIIGAGPAGLSCARLLAARGWSVRLAAGAPAAGIPPRQAVVLDGPAIQLLSMIWGGAYHDAVASAIGSGGGRWLVGRACAWERGEAFTPVWRRCLAIRLEELARGLADGLRRQFGTALPVAGPADAPADSAAQPHEWVVEARGYGTRAPSRRRTAGRRCAVLAEVALADPGACTYGVEAYPEGWAVLVPFGGGRATLQVMLATTPADPRL